MRTCREGKRMVGWGGEGDGPAGGAWAPSPTPLFLPLFSFQKTKRKGMEAGGNAIHFPCKSTFFVKNMQTCRKSQRNEKKGLAAELGWGRGWSARG